MVSAPACIAASLSFARATSSATSLTEASSTWASVAYASQHVRHIAGIGDKLIL